MSAAGLTERKALIDSLEVGDLISLNGTLRVVRAIGRRRPKSYLKDWQVYSIGLSILRCSWTRRPVTHKGRCDLYHCDLSVVQKGYGVTHTPIEEILQRDIETGTRVLECCDVIGVIT